MVNFEKWQNIGLDILNIQEYEVLLMQWVKFDF